jgi:hypothetical protein
MPIFDNEYTFIHIPKTGGSSIECWLTDNNKKMSLFSIGKKNLINGHSPQHCTFLELKELNLLTEKVFTIVRPDVERVISEYFYLNQFSFGYNKFKNFDSFLDFFLDEMNLLDFDYHNVSTFDFLKNENNLIDEKIKIFNFFETEEIEDFFKLKGLSKYFIYKTNKSDFQISKQQIKRIIEFFTLS